ncbi:TipAS antibiotic-recognition domain-containing protein [Sulfurospirillum oryzae]|uniref:TipAS antibiotic-recognition domain-containing protein n=1 Tax=Sulfurospirillum oryzae TaxID=2976535 RepID=UPI0021E8F85B|nr:TipAS antibiotic-recognition domain-containing protein [Sulfurospirillum oryzae]
MIKNASEEYLNSCREALQEEQNKSLSKTNNWEHVDRAKVHSKWDLLYKEIAQHIDNTKPDDIKIQELIAKHYAIACQFYIPTKKAYIAMGLFYEDNQDMKNYHNAYHPKMAEFLGNAMYFYAKANL